MIRASVRMTVALAWLGISANADCQPRALSDELQLRSDSSDDTCHSSSDALQGKLNTAILSPVFTFPENFASHFGLEHERKSYFSPAILDQFGQQTVIAGSTLPGDTGANISYFPDEVAYHERAQRRRQTGLLESSVPYGWPTSVDGSFVWHDDQLRDDMQFVHRLTAAELNDIDDALKFFKAQGGRFPAVTKSNFPLPTLGEALAISREAVYNGSGFSIIRGLVVDRYKPEDRGIVFLGISSYIAEERGAQDERGTMLKHIMDDERKESQTDLPFHTDVTCDVIALMTIQCSDFGGRSTISPAGAIYNELATEMPHVIHTLAEPNWPFDTFGRDPPFFYRAPLYVMNGKVIFNFSRRLLVGSPQYGRSPGVPKLSEAQAEAIDAVHFTARKHQLAIPMEQGDIRFVNNMGLLHGREWFHDSDASNESQRHVMRLWLRDSERQWNLPADLKVAWARIFDDHDRPVRWDADPVFEDGQWHGRGFRSECN